MIEYVSSVLEIPSTRARPSTSPLRTSTAPATDNDDTSGETVLDNEQPSPQKRPRIERHEQSTMAYWPDNPEARQVFQPITRSSRWRRMRSGVAVDDDDATARSTTTMMLCDETAKEALQQRIRLLQSVHASEDGWRNVVLGRDENSYCTKLEIFEIRQRSTFLCCAYQLALTNMNKQTWHDCCKMAWKFLNSHGLGQATFFKTIANWN